MNLNDPLDKSMFQTSPLSPQEVILRLQRNGFYEVYESSDEHIIVKGISGLNCVIKKDATNSWEPHISVDWFSSYVIIPAFALSIFLKRFGINGIVFYGILGLGVANLLLMNKKKSTLAQMREAIAQD